MGSRYYRQSYHPVHGNPGFPESHIDHPPFDRYPTVPTHQTTLPDPTVMQPTRYATVWDIRDSLRQTPAIIPMIPPADPVSPRASEGGYSLGSVQPIRIHTVQLQVRLAAVFNAGVPT